MVRLSLQSTFLLVVLTAEVRTQFFDIFQGFDPFLQTYQTSRPVLRPSYENTNYYAPSHNRRPPQTQRGDSRRHEENKNKNDARKSSRTERTTRRTIESILNTKNPLEVTTKNILSFNPILDYSNNRNRQVFNEPKTDSNKKQNTDLVRQKPNEEIIDASRSKSTRQKQTSRHEMRRNNSKPVLSQNKNEWETNTRLEVDLTDHRKDKRVPSYEESPKNSNSYSYDETSSRVQALGNEIKYPEDSSDWNVNGNSFDEQNLSNNAFNRHNNNENRFPQANKKITDNQSHNINNNRQNSNNINPTNTWQIQSSSVSPVDDDKAPGKRPGDSGSQRTESYERPVNNRPNLNERKPANNLWGTEKPPIESNFDRLTSKKPENFQSISDYSHNRPHNKPNVNAVRPASNQGTTASLFENQANNYNRQNSFDGRPDYNNAWTTQNPFNIPDGRPQKERKPTNRWTTQNPYSSGIVRPVGNENRPPITNRPPNLNRVHPTPITRQPVYDGITFPDDAEDTPDLVSGPDEDYMSETEKRRYIELAEKMCDKYKDMNTEHVLAIPLIPSPEPVSLNVSKCVPTNVPLIVGGKVVSIQEFPHMALLGWKNIQKGGYSWKCGGTLVSDQYVLTAAHCAYQERDNSVSVGPPRVVQLGSSFLDDPGAIVVRVSTAMRHPKYKLPSSYYDIAMLRLISRVTFSERIKPACLGVPPPPGESIIATGWGRTEYGGDQSHELRSVSLPIWRMDQCWRVLGTSRKLPNGPSAESQICAGETSGGKDTCQGDSGGPAQVQDGCAWRVVAVTSVGRACGAKWTPALYALVHRAFVAAVAFGGRK